MKLSGILVAVCVGSSGLCALILTPAAAAAVLFGMAAPLAVGLGTIQLVEQTTRTDIRLLTGRMTMAFVAKLVFYAVYVSVVLGLLSAEPIPFALSFTLYFAALQITEALYLHTLLTRRTRDAVTVS